MKAYQSIASSTNNMSKDHSEKGSQDSSQNLANYSLRSNIKVAVGWTNSALASLEEKSDTASNSFVSRLRVLGLQIQPFVKKTAMMYESRKSYGPLIAAGMGLVVGGVVTLKRGRLSGAFAGALSGTATYAATYGIDFFPTRFN